MFRQIAACALFIASPALAAERSFAVGNFDRLQVGGSPDVTVTTGKAVSVRATGAQTDLDRLEIRVVDGELQIGSKRDGGWSMRGDTVRIAVTVPMVRSIGLKGSGDVAVDRVAGAAFAATSAGSGSIRIAMLETSAASFTLAGSGNVSAAGRCAGAAVQLRGSGSADLGALKCRTLNAATRGSGSIAAFASQTATLATRGSGDIRVAGGARCTVAQAGSGTARCVA